MSGSTPAAPGRIFISYRRQETAYPAGWLYERVAAHFGRDQVFKDVDSIQLGDDFAEVIANAVGSCDVLLALIGDRWLTITDEDGRRRLDDPDDFVRLEIETALERNIRVIPVLFEGASLPRPADLPASLSKLVRRQALELSPSRFDADIGKLLRVLDTTLAEQARREAEAQAAREAEEQARRLEERKLAAIEKMGNNLRSGDSAAVVSAEGALRRLAEDTNERVAQKATRLLVDWEAAKQAQREAEDQQARRNAEQVAREAEEQIRQEQAAKAARETEEQTRREAQATAAREAEEQARKAEEQARKAEERKLSAIDEMALHLRSGEVPMVASAEGALRRLANDSSQRVAQAAMDLLADWEVEKQAKAEQKTQAKADSREPDLQARTYEMLSDEDMPAVDGGPDDVGGFPNDDSAPVGPLKSVAAVNVDAHPSSRGWKSRRRRTSTIAGVTIAVVIGISVSIALLPTRPQPRNTGQTNGASQQTGPASSVANNSPIPPQSILSKPGGIDIDRSGNLYIADTDNNRIRKVTRDRRITTIAGTGKLGFSGDNGPATEAELNQPAGVAIDGGGGLYIADTANGRIRKVTRDGRITTIAQVEEASGISGVAVDSHGNLYATEYLGGSIHKVTKDGSMTAVNIQLDFPEGAAAVDGDGNLYIADTGNSRVRKVSRDGRITTVAGTGDASFSGDHGPATKAHLKFPEGVAVDGDGNLFIADTGNSRVRKVSRDGRITTVAG